MASNPFQQAIRTELAADAEQQAALAAQRMKLLNANGKRPMVTLPFGKQQPLDKYAGIRVLPFIKNPFISDPSVILSSPDPTAHYGFARRDDPGVRGKLRSAAYEAVYVEELKHDTEAGIYVSEDIPIFRAKDGTIVPRELIDPKSKEILTERGVSQLVLWHGLMLIKIPHKTWMSEYEEPALMSAARLAMHQEGFENFEFQPTVTTTNDEGARVHASGGPGYREMRDSVKATMTVEA